MKVKFPYEILDRQKIIQQINKLANLHKPFLFIVDYKAEKGFVIEASDIDEQFIRFQLNGSNTKKKELTILNWSIYPVTANAYKEKFDYVQKHIYCGNSFLVNLTQPTVVSANMSLLEVFSISSAQYKLWLRDQFSVFSPESFVRITNGVISSFPMKGTIDATIPLAKELILSDPKEKAEHATIVDLIRNDLSIVASNVEVKRYRYIEKLQTNRNELLQVSSEICGRLPDNYHCNLGDILFTLLPAGSICGAPKPKTLEIIENAEKYDRGFYTGVFGFFDGENLDSAVMIRFIEQMEDKLVFKSGGGVTAQSDLKKEYEELIQKVYVPFC